LLCSVEVRRKGVGSLPQDPRLSAVCVTKVRGEPSWEYFSKAYICGAHFEKASGNQKIVTIILRR
jgi:hypothetical protein